MPSTVAPAFFNRSQNSAPLVGKCGEKKTKFTTATPKSRMLCFGQGKSGAFGLVAEVAAPRKSRFGKAAPRPTATVVHSRECVSKNSHRCNRPATSAVKGAPVRSSHRGDIHE